MAKKEPEKTGHILFILACLIFFTSLLLQGAFYPFVGVNAWNFNTYSQIAKNYTLFGYFPSFFAPIVSVSKTLPSEPVYYLHHPQLISIIQSLFFKTFSESFLVARLPVIIASVISAALFYKVSCLLKGKEYATLCLVIAILIPGFSIFGRMIGQEALVLMFALSTSFFFVKYLKKKSKLFASLTVFSVIVGTLSDWPMTYFVFFFAIYALRTKAKKLYVVMLATSVITACLFLIYVYVLNSGFSDLASAFLVRGPGEITRQSFWYANWFSTIILRLVIYIGPLILIAGFIGAVQSFRDRNKDLLFYFLLSLLFFGLCHILLYPEGSFGHAYWIYYLIPFFVFSSGLFAKRFLNQKLLLFAGVAVSLVYLLAIVHWKTGESRGNIFRFVLAESAALYLRPYEEIQINKESAVDPDLFEYAFNLGVVRPDLLDPNKSAVFTCSPGCGSFRDIEESLSGRVVSISTPDAKGIIYSNDTSMKTPNRLVILYDKQNSSESFAARVYSALMNILKFPQL